MEPADDVTFGISTYLFHGERLDRSHLEAIGSEGFEMLELFALRSHLDYRDWASLVDFGEWLKACGLQLHSVHAPIGDGGGGGPWGRPLTIGAAESAERERAVAETLAALEVASVVPYRYLVVHLDSSPQGSSPLATSIAAVHRSLDQLYPRAVEQRVRLAFETLDTPLSSPAALIKTIDQLELDEAGICLDFGHAHEFDGVIDAVETVSGSLWTTHVHDAAGGRRHLVPFDGVIDWDGALLALLKVGYDGPWILELDGGGHPLDVLRRAAGARRRLEATRAS